MEHRFLKGDYSFDSSLGYDQELKVNGTLYWPEIDMEDIPPELAKQLDGLNPSLPIQIDVYQDVVDIPTDKTVSHIMSPEDYKKVQDGTYPYDETYPDCPEGY